MFFTAMERSYIPMMVQIFILPMHVVWCEFYVIKLELGFIGVAFAAVTTDVIGLVIILMLVKCSKEEEVIEAWVPFNSDVFVEFGQFIKIAFAGLLIHCFEQWSNEALQFIAGWIGPHDLAAMVLIFTILSVVYFIPMSFSLSISALVGASLGQGRISKAQSTIYISFGIGGALILTIFIIF